jgi:hypothetical protein
MGGGEQKMWCYHIFVKNKKEEALEASAAFDKTPISHSGAFLLFRIYSTIRTKTMFTYITFTLPVRSL